MRVGGSEDTIDEDSNISIAYKTIRVRAVGRLQHKSGWKWIWIWIWYEFIHWN